MTDDAYGLWMALGTIAAAGALYFKWQQGRSLRKVIKMLHEQGIDLEKLVRDANADEAAKAPPKESPPQ